uniref:Uncharacterized protein n=1 Tax=Oryza meridionalis TaxID=40149 RepID=A0A0E0CJE6_9ORYZ
MAQPVVACGGCPAQGTLLQWCPHAGGGSDGGGASDEQCDTLIWVDPEWHPRVQKAFEQLWHLLECTNPGWRRSEWTCYVEKIKAEDGMKLELEMADRLSDMEISFKKKLSKQKKQTDDIRNWFIRTIIVVMFFLMKLFDNMFYARRC